MDKTLEPKVVRLKRLAQAAHAHPIINGEDTDFNITNFGQFGDDLEAVLDALPSADKPAGWKLVPVEPDGYMIRAGVDERDRPGSGASVSSIYRAMLSSAPAAPGGVGTRDERQKCVADWCAAAFGAEHQASVPQRGLRMLEEAIETYQSINGSPEAAHKLIDYIYAKEPGKLFQELGGLGITVLALAAAAGVSADAAETAELNRVLSKPPAWFHARNKAKNDAGFDAVAHPAIAPVVGEEKL